jgi:ABC-type nitrate/sulfonate/bicarbonate transport system ATPase subunit/ABC-type nitrate/sulfonate/bicarbonate transport system permease component
MVEMADVATVESEQRTGDVTRIRLRNLAKTFVGDGQQFTAIEGVDLEIQADDFFCLLGPSGCGKTTILNILAGFEAPTDGSAEFDGNSVNGPSRDRGVVFQADNSLYDWLSARQNVEFGLRLAGADQARRNRVADEFLALVGLADQGHKYPHELSGGMRQRVQLARVLANKPRMLVMDEPFAALDAQTRRVLQDELRRIWQDHRITVLFITHDIEEALLLGTRIGVMTAGPNAGIKALIDVPSTLKRDRVDMEFVRMYGHVQDLIADETNKSLAAQAGRIEDAGRPLTSAAVAATKRHKQEKNRNNIQGLTIYLLSIVGFFMIWHLGSLLLNSVLFPSPAQFLVTFAKLLLDGTLIQESYVSLKRIMAGFIIGSVIAMPLGLLMGSSRIMRLILEPYVELLRFIPSIAMITVAVIFFGLGEASRIFLIAWVTVFTVTINTAAGVASIEKNKIRAAQALGASKVQLFYLVTLPAAMPFILVGARIAMANAFTTIVAAEIIGANSGLGTMLWQARLYMLVDNIYVVLITLGILGLTIDRLFRTASRFFGKRYAPHI